MIEDIRDKERKRHTQVKSVMHITMGILLCFIGLWFLLYDKLGINVFNREPSPLDYFIGALFLLYGIFRIYRGIKKENFQ